MSSVQPRSSFVTVVAWISIVLSAFSTLVSVFQNIMLFTLFRTPGAARAMEAPLPPGTPAFLAFMDRHVALVFLGFLVLCVAVLLVSIGLLRRRNWARLCFIGLMVLGAASNLAGLVVQFGMVSSMRAEFAAAGTQGGLDMGPFLIGMLVVGTIFAVGFSVLYAWIAKRLMSPAIAAEFRG